MQIASNQEQRATFLNLSPKLLNTTSSSVDFTNTYFPQMAPDPHGVRSWLQRVKSPLWNTGVFLVVFGSRTFIYRKYGNEKHWVFLKIVLVLWETLKVYMHVILIKQNFKSLLYITYQEGKAYVHSSSLNVSVIVILTGLVLSSKSNNLQWMLKINGTIIIPPLPHPRREQQFQRLGVASSNRKRLTCRRTETESLSLALLFKDPILKGEKNEYT